MTHDEMMLALYRAKEREILKEQSERKQTLPLNNVKFWRMLSLALAGFMVFEFSFASFMWLSLAILFAALNVLWGMPDA